MLRKHLSGIKGYITKKVVPDHDILGAPGRRESRTPRHRRDYGIETHVARYHNIFGPEGTWTGGREKAPADAKLQPRADERRARSPGRRPALDR
jgi:hypothetical protein